MQKGTTTVEITTDEVSLTLVLPEKYDPSRAWPLHTEGTDAKAIVLHAGPKYLERAIALTKRLYPIALTEGEKAIASGQCAISPEKTALFTVPKLAPGVYAVTLFHDIGAPRFKDASFAITGAGPERTITVKLVHL